MSMSPSLAKPTEDPHFVDARPSFVVKLRQADVLIDGGAELEIGWLPPLLQNARNPKIEVGQPGSGAGFARHSADGSAGATDPRGRRRARDGQPAFHGRSDHRQGGRAAHRAMPSRAVDPAHAADYQANEKKFEATINAKLQEWGAKLLPFRGQSLVAYHDSWPYFAHRFGFNIDIFLEPKPGIPPSPSHLAEVIAQMKAQKIKAIIVEPYHNRKIAEKVAQSTGAKVVDFAQFPGALPDTDTYVKLIDTLVHNLAEALK